jgi:Xaa-Pro aminopeptidase
MRNTRKTRPGELVLMDCGASYCGYAGDISRTVPVSGKFSVEQRLVYLLALKAHRKAADAARPGSMFMAPHIAAMNVISEGLQALGITESAGEYRKYFSHGVSHYLGLDVHDPGSYGSLKVGSVITIEPGIYIPEGSPCAPKWWNIGVRIEDDYLITDGGAESLTPDLPKDPDEIEKLMSDK